ncbi:YicC/YloC family endoribonuclease [Alicyclobacillus pomorum]|uniref:YicC/YloC family endoribonuclease n=1 Tax=Alicyclobacillus pomorum TaxID=204470 RepID=UPI000425A133|nr:YicC/YloC family endoribonuclease [Alicyclobacillus pomorum]
MALCSMTGFGQAVVEQESYRAKVEIRSVNHRFAEFNIRAPRDLLFVEEEIRAYLSTRLARGRSDVFVSVEEVAARPYNVQVDWGLFDALCRVEREAAARSGQVAPASVSWTTWLTYPNVLQVQSAVNEIEPLRRVVMAAVKQACDALVAMREREGARLKQDLLAKLSELSRVVGGMSDVSGEVNQQLRDKLQQRLAEWLPQVDEQRLLMEVSLLAERSSVDEELVRLRSHIDEFQSSLGEGSPVGRRLDFIVQEMHREVNTIGSKSSDIRMSKAVVNAKTIVEQLREQVQNIE